VGSFAGLLIQSYLLHPQRPLPEGVAPMVATYIFDI
jgi:hypothetical protein